MATHTDRQIDFALEKLGEVGKELRVDHVILRPAAVYGPRDTDFLHLFRAVRTRFAPQFGGGRQELSLVFAPDLADATIAALHAKPAAGAIVNVAAPGFVTARELTEEIARQSGVRPVAPRLPALFLQPLCAAFTAWSRLTGRPHILSLEKYAELVAPGWVCRVDRLRILVEFTCTTGLETGIGRTLDWYRKEGWL
jgi:nucleoside-diphosphate-sugar epimerase